MSKKKSAKQKSINLRLEERAYTKEQTSFIKQVVSERKPLNTPPLTLKD